MKRKDKKVGTHPTFRGNEKWDVSLLFVLRYFHFIYEFESVFIF